ncbi:MAG: signal peptidase I [Erysipelotrichaceae bacterium]|nr:signal peptidase I [Erysipelotrichaceae bacterium]
MKSNKKINKKLQKSLVVIARLLASLVLVGVLLTLIPLSVPRLLGYETYNVVSGSMEPEIPVGSLLLVKPIDPYEVQEGDIIAYYSNAVVVSHRVVTNNTFDGRFVTKGDANADEDLKDVDYTELIGIVEHHYAFLGAAGAYISTSSGKLFIAELIICSMLLFIVSDKIKI